MASKTSLYRLAAVIVLCEIICGLAFINSGKQPRPAPAISRQSAITKHDPPSTPIMLPEGGRTLLPNYRLVSLYGTPDNPALGALGEQPAGPSIDRAAQIAALYQPYSKQKVMPALEIIATVASQDPTDNNDYSQEIDPASLVPWIRLAQKRGVYITLDLQPGRSDFLSQAKEYSALLKEPNVGLALDPEWRLQPDQVPLAQIGSVDSTEINVTSDWLSALTDEYKLPQKLFLLHQFRLDMITNRSALNTTHSNLAYVIQMDGSGTQDQKQDTWNVITQNAPPNVSFGWKNFFHQDSPVLSPQETMQKVPAPAYISYQ